MHFFDLRGFLIGGVIVGMFVVANGTGFLGDTWSSFRFSAALERTISCTDESNLMDCARPNIEKMLDVKSGAEIMEIVSTRVGPQQCHYISHALGQQLSQKMPGDIEAAISSCNRLCDSGCIHGIIGETFLTEAGYQDSDLDLAHLSPQDLQNIGRRLCVSSPTCHGVGHALFLAYREIEPMTRMCREVATGLRIASCYQGGFMEYADTLSARSLKTMPEVEFPSLDSLSSFCIFPTPEENYTCFRYFPRIAAETLMVNGLSLRQAEGRVRDMCASFQDEDTRLMCVMGIGVYSAYAVVKDPRSAIQACEEFPDALDKMACHFGQISAAIQDRQQAVITYCGALPDSSMRPLCYHGVFFYLNQLGTPVEETIQFCGNNSVCLAEAENRDEHPAKRAKELFGS